MLWLKSLWNDETGSVLCTAEAVLLGTMGVVGATVGLNLASTSVNEELKDVSHSLRHLDQSYEVAGFTGCRAKTAGSSFQQEDVKKSIKRLEKLEDDLSAEQRRGEKDRRERLEELREKLRRDAELERKRAEDADRKNRKPSSKRRRPGDDDDD